MFLTQGLKPCLLDLLHWQADSLPLSWLFLLLSFKLALFIYPIGLNKVSWTPSLISMPVYIVFPHSEYPFTSLIKTYQPLWVFPHSSVGKESTSNEGDPGSGRSAGEGIGYPLQHSWASLVAQLVKNLPAMQVNLGSIPGLGRSPGEGNGYPVQHSGLENSMDCIVHGVTKSRT